MPIDRREIVTGAVIGWLVAPIGARGAVVAGHLPWSADAGSPPVAVRPGAWQFFSREEAEAVEALVDRLIPPDATTPGGKGAGCAVYVDRQLAGPFGRAEGLYRQGPFAAGTPEQGDQVEATPAARWRAGLAALDRHCRSAFASRPFAALTAPEQDGLLAALEQGSVALEGADARAFFEQLLKATQEGFFADPIYGGNRDMCAWKMIGFPGARYDYRDWVDRHNERYPLPPVSIGRRRSPDST